MAALFYFAKRLFCSGFFLCILFTGVVHSQNTTHLFEQLDVSGGLSQSTVYTILQDSRGFMWFGTRDGLNRFDGYSFEVFNNRRSDSLSLGNASIREIIELPGYTFLAATDGGGIYHFDWQKKEFRSLKNAYQADVPGENILALAMQDKNVLWAGTRSKGIIRIDLENKSVKSFHTGSTTIWSVHIDRNNRVWAGSENGLLFLNDDNMFEPVLTGNRVNAIAESPGGGLLIGTTGRGLVEFDSVAKTIIREFSPSKKNFTSADVLSVLSVSDNEIWVGTNGGGLIILHPDDQEYTIYRSDNQPASGISGNTIRSLYRDRSGVIWAGTNNSGLNLWSETRSKFAFFNGQNESGQSKTKYIILSIMELSSGSIWVGTSDKGVLSFDIRSGKFTPLLFDTESQKILLNNEIISLLEYPRGTVWIGTDGGGLIRLQEEGGGSQYYLHDPADSTSISDNTIISLLKDRDNRLWVGTYNGLNILDEHSGKFRRLMHEDDNHKTISDNRILSLIEDSNGLIWAGTYSGGVNIIEPETGDVIMTLQKNGVNSLSSNRIISLFEDDERQIWMGTPNGLNRYNPDKSELKIYDIEDGLPNSVIYGILADGQGLLWLSSNRGITRFDPKNESMVNFGLEDGLQGLEFNGGATHKNRNGVMFFGGTNGLNAFHPETILFNERPPEVRIVSFNISGVKQEFLPEPDSTVVLNSNENFFSVGFSALDFTSSGENRYRYKLENLDNEWIEAGTRNEAFYTSVPPGSYRLLVQGSNNDGVWSAETPVISLKILKPLWKTWWFTTIVFCFFAFLVTGAYQYRVQNLLKIEKMKKQIADDLHDDIGAKISSIALMLDVVTRHTDHGENHPLTDRAKSVAREAVLDLRDAIWFIDHSNDFLDSLLNRMRKTAEQILVNEEINFFITGTGTGNIKLNVEQRRNFYLIFKEALHNILKHAEATKISIRISVRQNSEIQMEITDNGKGFETSIERQGRGLRTMRQRAGILKGTFDIHSSEKTGTTLLLRFNIV